MSETDSTRRAARLGNYSLVAEIARGGMGIVYLAQSIGRLGFKKLVVVKELKPELAEDEKFREMFLDEARLAARLNHRNIVQTTEVDQDGDRYFFVMEYLEGRTLHDVGRLKKERALSTATILRIICDVLAGLHYAHELADYDGTPLGIVHRDVSPRNVFLTYDGQVKVLDFGVAKAAGRDQETEAGELKGRVPYMAPEHVSDDMKIDRRADIFPAGVLLREALTGKRLWDGFNEIEILRELLQRRIPPLPDGVEINDEAKAIIDKAMAPDREDRYRTAHEMRTELERYVARIDPSGSFAKAGEHISTVFASHRANVRALIEEHVARANSLPPEAEEILPTLPLSSPELAAAVGSDPSRPSEASKPTAPSKPIAPERRAASPSSPTISAQSSRLAASSPKETPPPSSSGAALATSAPSSSPVLATTTAGAATAPVAPARSAVKDISIPPPPPKSPVVTYVFFGLGFLVVVAGLTALLLSTGDAPRITNRGGGESTSPVPTATERPHAAPSASASASPEDDFVEVTVQASPPTAWISIDNVLVGEGPYTKKYKRGSRHVVRATAPGYVTKSETLEVTATASMNLVLEKEAGAAPVIFPRPHPPVVRTTTPPPTPPPTPTPTVEPTPTPSPTSTTAPSQRPVDPRSPYEK